MSYRRLSWLIGGTLALAGCEGHSSSDGGSGAAGGPNSSHAGSATTAPKASGGTTLGGGLGGSSATIQGGALIGGAGSSEGGMPGLGGAADIGGNVGSGVGGISIGAAGTIGKGGWTGATTGGATGRGGAGGKTGTSAMGSASGKGGSASTVSVSGGSTPGGTSAKGGSGTGGVATGGVATGGVATGGVATGGTSSAVTTGGTQSSAAGSSNGSDWPAAGNPDGACAIPADAQLEDVSSPTHVVGSGTKESCTGAEFVKQVALGGIITFNCGPDPVTIVLDQTAKIFNDAGPKIVIDGGGKVTLSGQDKVRILYQNTCDEEQHWTTSHCNNQDHPQLTVQNLTFVHANSKSETEYAGGGAIYASGGRLKIINSRFFNNACADTGPDVGGAAVRAFQQSNGLPVYVVSSTFGGRDDLGNVCSNGGGISSIGVSWTIINSLFSYNQAIGNGGNPADPGTPGGGSGGAIYNDGNTMTLTLCGTKIENNTVKAYGGAIFFVSNDHTGNVSITDSVIRNNPGGSWYPVAPGISTHDDTPISIVNSTVQP